MDLFMQLRGVAQLRGERWAQTVAQLCPIDKPWPFTEKSRAIAMRKVADLGGGDPELQEKLASEVELGAMRWWNKALEQAG